MKTIFKIILIIILFLFLFIFIGKNNDSKTVFMENERNGNHYKLIFSKEPLTIRTIKLKLTPFINNGYITKIYVKYDENLKDYFKDKEYFSFDNSSINTGIDTLKKEYLNVLSSNYLYNEIEKDINDVSIESVDVYAEESVINNFKNKFKNAIVEKINEKY
ncbi:unknown [Clostridium sp. CAG:433]|nr:unknown [Clostridium sp. CAG:433]